MTNLPTDKLRESLSKDVLCINSSCDLNGTIANQISEDEWEPQQCQFCFEYRFPLVEKMIALLLSERTRLEELLPKEKDTSGISAIVTAERMGFNACLHEVQRLFGKEEAR